MEKKKKKNRQTNKSPHLLGTKPKLYYLGGRPPGPKWNLISQPYPFY